MGIPYRVMWTFGNPLPPCIVVHMVSECPPSKQRSKNSKNNFFFHSQGDQPDGPPLINIPLPPPLPTPPSHSTSGGGPTTLLRKEAQKDRREFPPSLTFKSTATAEEKPQSTHVRTLTSDLAELETLVAKASSTAALLEPHTEVS